MLQLLTSLNASVPEWSTVIGAIPPSIDGYRNRTPGNSLPNRVTLNPSFNLRELVKHLKDRRISPLNRSQEYRVMRSVSMCRRLKSPSASMLLSQYRRRPILIPYTSPEFIAAILIGERASVREVRTNYDPIVEHSVPVLRSQSMPHKISMSAPLQQKTFWSRCYFLLAFVAKILVLWLV